MDGRHAGYRYIQDISRLYLYIHIHIHVHVHITFLILTGVNRGDVRVSAMPKYSIPFICECMKANCQMKGSFVTLIYHCDVYLYIYIYNQHTLLTRILFCDLIRDYHTRRSILYINVYMYLLVLAAQAVIEKYSKFCTFFVSSF